MSLSIQSQSLVFKALGHPSRLAMVHAMNEGELCVTDLQEVVGDSLSTVSRHLAVLKNAGVVSSRKEGLNIYYSIKLPCLRALLKCFKEDNCKPCGCP